MTPSTDIHRLLDIMAALRDPESGCPWDVRQTFETIAPYTIEEAYEVVDAIRRQDLVDLKDELGDLLLQVVFHARMAEEQSRFSFADVVEAVTRKLIRRHPHVFGEAEAETAGEVLRNWDRIKREEEGRGADDPFADVPENLPALLYARKMQRRAVSAGLTGEEAQERLGDDQTREATERWIGETLFELVDMARRLRVDPELALRAAAQRFRDELSET